MPTFADGIFVEPTAVRRAEDFDRGGELIVFECSCDGPESLRCRAPECEMGQAFYERANGLVG